MKGFFLNLKTDIDRFFKRSGWLMFIFVLAVMLGVLFGIFTISSDLSFSSILNLSDKLIFGYMSGTSSGSASIFFTKLLEFLFVFVLVFLFCLSIYSTFLAFLFVSYQAFLLVIVCSTIIGLYDFVGILNVILIIIPINLLFFALLFFVVSISTLRAFDAKRFNMNLGVSFKYSKYFQTLTLCVVLAIAISFVFAFILPLLLKCFLLIVY